MFSMTAEYRNHRSRYWPSRGWNMETTYITSVPCSWGIASTVERSKLLEIHSWASLTR